MKIHNHEFTDGAINKVASANEVAVCLDVQDAPWVALFKVDVIELAKHFNLTVDDLKDKHN